MHTASHKYENNIKIYKQNKTKPTFIQQFMSVNTLYA